MESLDVEKTLKRTNTKTYKKPSSVTNAEKARLAKAKKLEELRNKPPVETESDFSEDEIVYIPTTRKSKKKLSSPKEPVEKEEPKEDMTKKEIEELKKALQYLQEQQNNKHTKEPPPRHHKKPNNNILKII